MAVGFFKKGLSFQGVHSDSPSFWHQMEARGRSESSDVDHSVSSTKSLFGIKKKKGGLPQGVE